MPGFGGGAVMVAVPGHLDGSIAMHLPGQGVLYTGDAVADVGRTMPGAFTTDRARAIASPHRPAAPAADMAISEHGGPVVHGGAAALRAAAAATR